MLIASRYAEHYGFARLALENKLKIKADDTIVEKWPMALKLSKGHIGFDEEFERLDASDHWGAETYIEWASVEYLHGFSAVTALCFRRILVEVVRRSQI
jgi:hypothetical protein